MAPVRAKIGSAGSRKPLGSSFWKLFASSAITNLSDGIGTVAIPLLGASLTKNPLLISGLTSLTFLPWLLFGLPGGALVDRLDRRLTMSVVNLCRAAVIGVLAIFIVNGAAQISLLYAAAFLLGAGEVLYDSAARAILPQVVARKQLDSANSWLTTEETLGQDFLGAPIGSALFALASAVAFIGNAAGFSIAAVLVLTVPGRFKIHRSQTTTLRADIGEGLHWLWRHPVLRNLTVFTGLTAALMSMATSLRVLYVLQHLHLPPAFYGLFLITAGLGGLAGSAAVKPLTTLFGRVRLLIISASIPPVMLILLGFSAELWAAGVIFVALSAGVTIWNVMSMSLRQAMIPAALLGRVLGAYRVSLWGGIPLGAVIGGLIADWTSVPIVYVIAGSIQIVIAFLIYRLIRIHWEMIQNAFQDTYRNAVQE